MAQVVRDSRGASVAWLARRLHEEGRSAVNQTDTPAPSPWSQEADAVERALGSGAAGLSDAEVRARLERFGPNQTTEERAGNWARVWRQIANPLVGILAVAALISVGIGEGADAAVILAILVLNGVAGFLQEWKADQAVEALRSLTSGRVVVVRDGRRQQVEPVELVPGDRVVLEPGDVVPADLRLVVARGLEVDESSLTGESVAVHKQVEPVPADRPLAERTSMGFQGTHLTRGYAEGVVTATGERTEVGRIAELAAAVAPEPTPLRRQLARVSKQLGVAAVLVTVAIAVGGWLAGGEPTEMFLAGVALAVAVVPEGLVAAVTVTLALGVRQMAARNVLLRRLEAVEALGAATVICTDKTGTLTRNEMSVARVLLGSAEVVVQGSGYRPEGTVRVDGAAVEGTAAADLRAVLQAALDCSHAEVEADGSGVWQVHGDPMEGALVAAARARGLVRQAIDDEVPFDADRRWMSVRVGERAVVKGAPEVLLGACTHVLVDGQEVPLRDGLSQRFEQGLEGLGAEGLRVIAVARQPVHGVNEDLVLLGLIALIDPPREGTLDAVERAQAAGIVVHMVTGDAPATARTIAGQVGLRGEVIARATPEDKLRLIARLQSEGHVVAMTGDGVNDAPALKAADVGVAMGLRGTDVARGAADIVLTDDRFASIVAGIEEGRRQLDNIGKFLRYLLSSNSAEVLAIAGNLLFGGPLLLLPVQILWMNLVTDGPTAIALGLERAEPDVMDRPPRGGDKPLLDGRSMATVLGVGVWMGGASVAVFQGVLATGGDLATARTAAFTALIVLQKVNVLNFRALGAPLHTIGWFSNPWLLIAVAATLGLHVLALTVPALQELLHTVPLGLKELAWIALAAVPVVLVPELVKTWRHR